MPILNTSLKEPAVATVYAQPVDARLPSQYLSDEHWVEVFKSVVKGVHDVPIITDLMAKADDLALAFEQRLDPHISDRVKKLSTSLDIVLHPRQPATFGRSNVSCWSHC